MKATAQSQLSLQLTGMARTLWQWWSGEIASMMPARLTRLLAGQKGRLVLTVERDEATLLQEASGRRRRMASFDLASADASEAREVIAAASGAPTLELAADMALRRTVALPAAAEANLAEVVSFELERHTPFRRADTYHVFRPIARDASRQRLMVEVTVVRRDVIDGVLAQLRDFGLEIGAVTVAGEGVGAASSPNLLPNQSASRAARLPRLAVSILAVTACALAIAVIAIPIVRVHTEDARIEAELQPALQQAGESARLQKQIDAARAERGFLAARKHKIVPVSLLLDTLTRLLPDDTWLTDLKVTGTDLEIAGSGASASAVVALIDWTSGLSDAAFRSPVTQDDQHREQFDIGAHLKGAAPP